MSILPREYNVKERDKLLDSIGIIVDSRERANQHITSTLDKQKICYKVKKLEHGDYSFYIPTKKELGILEDVSFEDFISIERKSGADELAGSFTTARRQFEAEYKRHKGKMILMIEDDSYSDICSHNYRSKLNPKSFVASLHSWQHRYNVPFIFIIK